MKSLLVCLMLTVAACSAVKESSDVPRLGESSWQLTAIEQRNVSFGDRAFIKFDEKESKAAGRAVCNSFFSEYEMSGSRIAFSGVGSTKMYCEGVMDQENQIISNLQRITRYEVKADFLYLYAGDQLALTFKR